MLWFLLIPTSKADQACAALQALVPEDQRAQGMIIAAKDLRRIAWVQDGRVDLAQCWTMALAPSAPSGTKQRQGDLRTPEGWYRTSDKPWSQFYGAIAVHYPNANDARSGVDRGLITQQQASTIESAISTGKKPPQNTALGGEILVHGGGAQPDWTLGCLAMDNSDLDILRTQMPDDKRGWIYITP